MITLPKAITFDCYGTLIDWESAIQQFFAESLDAKQIGYVDPKTLQTEWEEIQFHYIQERYRPYRQVLETISRYERCNSGLAEAGEGRPYYQYG